MIDGQATICSAVAQASRKAAGETGDLSGYEAREMRDKLATAATIVLPGQDSADFKVVSACADKLRDATAT